MVTTDLVVNTANALTVRVQQPDKLLPITIPSPPSMPTEETTTTEDDDDMPSLIPQGEADEDSDDEVEDEDETDDEEQEEKIPQPSRRSARIAQGIKPPTRYVLVTKMQAIAKRLDEKKPDEKTLEIAKWKAIEAEILQVFVELKALMHLMREDIPADAEVLRSFIFLVEKFLANGDFDKVKGRIVANGAQQSRELYPNWSSPTVGIHSIMTCLIMAAQLDDYILSKVDVKGAYL
jgi:hypothetical protein